MLGALTAAMSPKLLTPMIFAAAVLSVEKQDPVAWWLIVAALGAQEAATLRFSFTP